jgi:transcriptional antiterminator/mannitol/fructose-specific phosphotransferase system IIA component (Ntr-type)
MGIKDDREKRVLRILSETGTWTTASTLAKMVGVTERTIRNYASELIDKQQIVSSGSGYMLAGTNATKSAPQTESSPTTEDEHRVTSVLAELLRTSEPVSLFEMADRLYVSDSTVANTVIPSVRQLLARYNIKLRHSDFNYWIEGTERDKRRLIGFLASSNSYGYFSSANTLAKMFPTIDTRSFMQRLTRICEESGLTINSYSKNSLLIHILVILIRLGTDNALDDGPDIINISQLLRGLRNKENILACARRISALFENDYHRSIPQRDFRQILLLIALSSDTYSSESLTLQSVAQLINPEFLANVSMFAQETASRYGLPAFDEYFILQITVHIFNAYQRSMYGVSIKNPITRQVKSSYPAIYDMAIYFINRFGALYEVELSEDETAFIAFYIGAYLEKNKKVDARLSCEIVTEHYHDYSSELIEAIASEFKRDIVVTAAASLNDFLEHPQSTDLIITTIPLPPQFSNAVLISPLLNKKDARSIRRKLDALEQEQTAQKAKIFFKELLSPNLYVRNVTLGSQNDYIEYLCSLALSKGLVSQGFAENVKLRERISSTAFVEGLAMPHAIDHFTIKSFICVLHNDEPLRWGANEVNFVLLVGLSREDMERFQDVMNVIVERFSSATAIRRLIKSDSFPEFVSALTDGS